MIYKKSRILLIALFILILTGCAANTDNEDKKVYRNQEIDQSIRDTINGLDKVICDGISANQPEEIIKVADKDFVESGDISGIISKMNETLNDKSVKSIAQYYTKKNPKGIYRIDYDDEPYYLSIEGIRGDVFVSLIKTNTDVADYLMSLIYKKTENEWKLDRLFIGEYCINGMTTIDYYQKAKTAESEGYILPAYLFIWLSEGLAEPYLGVFHYKAIDNIEKLYDNIYENYNSQFTFPANSHCSKLNKRSRFVECVKKHKL